MNFDEEKASHELIIKSIDKELADYKGFLERRQDYNKNELIEKKESYKRLLDWDINYYKEIGEKALNCD